MNFSPLACTLRQLQYIVAVGDELNFRRAAKRCFVSQPSLSAQVAEVEVALGVKLFERNRRGVVITDAGREIISRAKTLLVLADDLAAAADTFRDPFSGVIKLGVIPTIGPYLLPELDPALRAAFPNLEIQWIEDKTNVLVEKVESADLDAAVLALEADIGNLHHEHLLNDHFVLAMPTGHHLATGKKSFRVRDLQDYEVLLLDDGHCFRDQALELCAVGGAAELGFRATSLPTLVQMVGYGENMTLLPEMALDVENRHGRLAIRRFSKPAPFRTIVFAWRAGAAKSDAFATIAHKGKQALKNRN